MRLRLIAAAMLLSACQPGLPDRAPAAAAVSPITGGAIRVTALEDPAAVAVRTDPGLQAAADAVATQSSDADVPNADVPDADVPAPQPEPEPVPPPPTAKSVSQMACEKRGGDWVVAGTTGTMICQTQQPDAGKQCSRKSDCEGQCLARSRSCAPVAPLFGCNEVLQDNGQRVTLCIE